MSGKASPGKTCNKLNPNGWSFCGPVVVVPVVVVLVCVVPVSVTLVSVVDVVVYTLVVDVSFSCAWLQENDRTVAVYTIVFLRCIIIL